MSGRVTLSLRAPLEALLDLEGLTPDRLAGLSAPQIARLPVLYGSRTVALGDLFQVRGERSAQLRIEGDLSRAVRVGAGMQAGELVVDGSVGDEAGLAMAGGLLRVEGRAGARLGGAAPGASKGTTGGEIIVAGAAGERAGERLRRGLIVVAGDAGQEAGREMLAGTLVVTGRTGPHAGRGSRRGSIIALGGIDIPPTYRYACTFEPGYVRVLMTHLRRRHGLPMSEAALVGRYRRYCGDLGVPGRGEILVLDAPRPRR